MEFNAWFSETNPENHIARFDTLTLYRLLYHAGLWNEALCPQVPYYDRKMKIYMLFKVFLYKK